MAGPVKQAYPSLLAFVELCLIFNEPPNPLVPYLFAVEADVFAPDEGLGVLLNSGADLVVHGEAMSPIPESAVDHGINYHGAAVGRHAFYIMQ